MQSFLANALWSAGSRALVRHAGPIIVESIRQAEYVRKRSEELYQEFLRDGTHYAFIAYSAECDHDEMELIHNYLEENQIPSYAYEKDGYLPEGKLWEEAVEKRIKDSFYVISIPNLNNRSSVYDEMDYAKNNGVPVISLLVKRREKKSLTISSSRSRIIDLNQNRDKGLSELVYILREDLRKIASAEISKPTQDKAQSVKSSFESVRSILYQPSEPISEVEQAKPVPIEPLPLPMLPQHQFQSLNLDLGQQIALILERTEVEPNLLEAKPWEKAGKGIGFLLINFITLVFFLIASPPGETLLLWQWVYLLVSAIAVVYGIYLILSGVFEGLQKWWEAKPQTIQRVSEFFLRLLQPFS